MKILSLFALALAVLAPGAAAQTATLAEDIAAQEVPFLFAGVQSLQPVGQRLFFVRSEPTSGNEPWTTDGTVSGTRMLADACPEDDCFSQIELLGTFGGRLVWSEGRLWSTDGTPAGTTPLTDPDLRIGDTRTYDSVRLGERLYFPACRTADFDTRCAVWSTDGTAAGTAPVPLLTPDPDIEGVFDLAAGDDRVYFVARGAPGSRPLALWAADAAGARRLLEMPDGFRGAWTAWGNRYFFVADVGDDAGLWVSDGTEAGTRPLATFAGGLRAWLSTGPSGLYFVADDVTHGEEIWRSDGTPAGTRRLTEIGYFEPFYLFFFDEGQEGWAFEIDGRLLFAADDRLSGRRLWTSTGTPGSTKATGQPGLGSRLYRAGNRLFAYRYDANQDDCEVWSFDSKGAGTRLIDRLSREICGPDSFWRNIRVWTVGSRAYFAAQEASSAAWSVWRSDGTVNGTVRLLSTPPGFGISDLAVMPGESSVYFATALGLSIWDARDGARQIAGAGPRSASSFPSDLTAHQGRLAFTAGDGAEHEAESSIWSSQGSEADTSVLVTPAGAGCPAAQRLVSTGPQLVFVCDLYVEDDELRAANPAGGGSTLLAEGVPDHLILLGHEGRVWFAKGDGQEIFQEIWTTDGTPAGTVRLTDAGGSPLQALHSQGTLPASPWALSDGQLVYFLAARPGDSNGRLWRSDGTPAGTIPLAALPIGGGFEVARAGATTLVRLGDGLWRTDGSAAGTARLNRADGNPLLAGSHLLTGHDGAFFTYADQGFRDKAFWRTDGTEAGTVALVPGFGELSAYGDDLPLPRPVSLGAKLVFVASDPAHGAELWITDGTPAGTSLLADIAAGPAGSTPARLVAAGGAVWFTAWDPAHGRELWRTDGTAAGTRLVQDIAPEGRSASPGPLVAAGDRLYFAADDGITGRELWSVPLAGAGACQPSDTALCLQGGRFRVESRWRDFQGNGGAGRAVPLTGDTGTFWFFSPSNVEVLLKVLDGRGLNDHFWVFYGALSSVEYSLTVTDTQTGLARRYSNPAGQLASAGDTEGFGPRGAQSTVPDVLTAAPSPPPLTRGWSSAAATAPCDPGPRRLCLNNGRFAVEVAWKDFQGNLGQGTALPFTGDTGFFWFFDQANVELAVKVLDGRPLNGRFWVFYGALSSVEYTITVTDTQTGSVKEYRNPAGRFGSAGDTGAF